MFHSDAQYYVSYVGLPFVHLLQLQGNNTITWLTVSQ